MDEERTSRKNRCIKKRAIEGLAKDMMIMKRLDQNMAPLQPARSREYRIKMLEEQFPKLDGPVATKMIEMTPEEATKMIKKKAFELGADLIGCTGLDPRFLIKGKEVAGEWAISIAVEMNYDDISTAPGERSGIEVTRAYYILGKVIIDLAAYIRSLGYKALAHHPRSMYGKIGSVLHKPIAYYAGIGEIGRNTLIVTPEFGPRVRIATITTELEIVPSSPLDIGIEKVCKSCRLCFNGCPTKAIPKEKVKGSFISGSKDEGDLLWRLDYNKCMPFFVKTDGCAICIKVCRFNKPRGKAIGWLNKAIKRSFKSRARSK